MTAAKVTARPQVTIYTDGACSGNPGPGGWGAVLLSPGYSKEIAGSEPQTTNNRMELMAAIKALHQLNQPSDVEIFTDSMYLKQGITEWLPQWKSRNWKTASRKPVKNTDLWMELERAQHRHKIRWCWVKAHAGNRYNELADSLASDAIKSLLA